jgi:hypothetical protein
VADGASSTAAWLRWRLQAHPGAAKAEVGLAVDLLAVPDGVHAPVAEALAGGQLSLAQAESITRAVRKLPSVVSDQTRREGSALLVEQAAELGPDHLDRLGRHLIQVLDPEHGAALERDELHQAETEEFSLRVGHDGKRAARGEFSAANDMLLQARWTR